MQEILFWLIVIPVMCVIGAVWVIRSTPIEDVKRLPPTWQSGAVRSYQPMETGERSDPPLPPSAMFTVEEMARGLQMMAYALDVQNRPYRLPESSPSTGYTPLLDDDPYEHEEETGNETLMKVQRKPDTANLDIIVWK